MHLSLHKDILYLFWFHVHFGFSRREPFHVWTSCAKTSLPTFIFSPPRAQFYAPCLDKNILANCCSEHAKVGGHSSHVRLPAPSSVSHISPVNTNRWNNVVVASYPAGIWCKNDVVLTLMRRDDVASTLIRRHFRTKCPLGRISVKFITVVSTLFQ